MGVGVVQDQDGWEQEEQEQHLLEPISSLNLLEPSRNPNSTFRTRINLNLNLETGLLPLLPSPLL